MAKPTIIHSQLKQILVSDSDSFFEIIKKDLSKKSSAYDEFLILENQWFNFQKSKRLGLLNFENETLRRNQFLVRGIEIINTVKIQDFSNDSLGELNVNEILNAKDNEYLLLQKDFEKFLNSSINSLFSFFLKDLEQKLEFTDVELDYLIEKFSASNEESLIKLTGKLEDYQETIESIANELDDKSDFFIKKYSEIKGKIHENSKEEKTPTNHKSDRKSLKFDLLESLIEFSDRYRLKDLEFRRDVSQAELSLAKSGYSNEEYKIYVGIISSFLKERMESLFVHFKEIKKTISKI